MKIRWSPTAVADLESIRSYIAQDSPSAASNVAREIKSSVQRLKAFPHSGRVGRVQGTLELVIPGTSYIAAYRALADCVEIIAVLHGHQRWPESFG